MINANNKKTIVHSTYESFWYYARNCVLANLHPNITVIKHFREPLLNTIPLYDPNASSDTEAQDYIIKEAWDGIMREVLQ